MTKLAEQQNNLLIYTNHFKRFYRLMFQPLGQRYGLSQLEIDVLLFLYNNPAYNTARDICAMRGFAKSNVSNAVELLREEGYLCCQPDPANRKLQRLLLLPQQQDRVEALVACQQQCFAAMQQGLSEQEQQAFRTYLQRMDGTITDLLAQLEKPGAGKQPELG